MADVLDFPPLADRPELLIGPFQEYRVMVEGRTIPWLTGFKDGPENTALVVDHRFSISVPNERASDVAWLLANAMAVASGYSHLGAESKEQPFAPKGMALNPNTLS